MTLRERQKAGRHKRILSNARKRFSALGYDSVTIEEIAAQSDVSSVTIYNYFGSKAGLLLELVSESDGLLIAKLDEMIGRKPASLPVAAREFGRILRDHAMSYLEKPTWRVVLAASIQEGSGKFGQTYANLDKVLIEKMAELVINLRDRGLLPDSVEAETLADCLFSLQNIRFFQFIADDGLNTETVDEHFAADLRALGTWLGPVEERFFEGAKRLNKLSD